MVTTKGYPYELIGKRIQIVASKNTHDVGITGVVVDETKATLHVEQQGKIKTLLKHNITIKLSTGELIQGETLVKRPEERLKGN